MPIVRSQSAPSTPTESHHSGGSWLKKKLSKGHDLKTKSKSAAAPAEDSASAAEADAKPSPNSIPILSSAPITSGEASLIPFPIDLESVEATPPVPPLPSFPNDNDDQLMTTTQSAPATPTGSGSSMRPSRSDSPIPPVPPLPAFATGSASTVSSSDGTLTNEALSPPSTLSQSSSLTTTTSPPPANAPGTARGRKSQVFRSSAGSTMSSRSASQPRPSSSQSSSSFGFGGGGDGGGDRIPSSRTSTTSLNVKFAPLPELEQKKRRHHVPMGIAARGPMMRKRRQQMGLDNDEEKEYPSDDCVVVVNEGNAMWTQEEIQRHVVRQMVASEQARLRAAYEPLGRDEDENEEEDPFVALGRAMKVAWRKMANGKDGKKKKKGDPNNAQNQHCHPSEQDDENAPGRVVVDPQKRELKESILLKPVSIHIQSSSTDQLPWEAVVGQALVRHGLATDADAVTAKEQENSFPA